MDNADRPRFHQTVRQKTDAKGNVLSIWSWQLQRDNMTVAFGECRCEQQAVLAVEAAKQRYGFGLETTGSVSIKALSA